MCQDFIFLIFDLGFDRFGEHIDCYDGQNL